MSRSIYVDVEVDLDQFDDQDLIDELTERGYSIDESKNDSCDESKNDSWELLTKIWTLRRVGRNYEQELDALIYETLGKVI